MTNVYYVGQDDAGWVLDILCSDADGPVELINATGILLFLGRPSGEIGNLVCTAEADYPFTNGDFINPGTSGKSCIARYIGTAAVATPGAVYNGRIQVTWGGGTVRSFPTTKDYFTVNVTPRP